MTNNENNFIVGLDDLMPVIREQLAAGKSVTFTPTGSSMMPMLRHNKDVVTLSPITGELKTYDLPLYQRDNGKYVLHRIVGTGDTYTCMGDNQFIKEFGLRAEQMIGVVTEFYRGDSKHTVGETRYKVYCRVWYHSRKFRHLWRKIKRKVQTWLR